LAERHPQGVEDQVGRMWEASCQPTTLREEASITKEKNEAPSQERR
jgi:hypothetical protein